MTYFVFLNVSGGMRNDTAYTVSDEVFVFEGDANQLFRAIKNKFPQVTGPGLTGELVIRIAEEAVARVKIHALMHMDEEEVVNTLYDRLANVTDFVQRIYDRQNKG